MARRFDLGRALLAAGAALLLISLFVEWYGTGPTGWQVFEALDLVLAGLAVAALWTVARADVAPSWLAWALPAAALFIVAVQLVDPPPAAGDGDPSTGAWLALGGAALMAAGAALSLASISVTVQVRDRERRRRMAAVDRRDDRIGPREQPIGAVRAERRDDDRTQPFSVVGEDDEPRPRPLLARDEAADDGPSEDGPDRA